MNRITLTGRLTKDPEILYFGDGTEKKAVAKFTLAVNRIYKKENKTADFFQCVAFGKVEQLVVGFVKKGSHVLLSGRMQNNDYSVEGKKVYGYQLVVENIEFLDKKEKEISEVEKGEDGYMEVSDDEELPFY